MVKSAPRDLTAPQEVMKKSFAHPVLTTPTLVLVASLSAFFAQPVLRRLVTAKKVALLVVNSLTLSKLPKFAHALVLTESTHLSITHADVSLDLISRTIKASAKVNPPTPLTVSHLCLTVAILKALLEALLVNARASTIVMLNAVAKKAPETLSSVFALAPTNKPLMRFAIRTADLKLPSMK